MAGTGAITETEIRAFFLNRRIVPEPWEIELLVMLDFESMCRDDDE